MTLSKRLLCISNLVLDEEHIIDIGCDHALIDIYLTMYKNCKCTAIDVNENILNKAIENINSYGLNDKIKILVGNGFDDLNLDYNSTIILSGMGTDTMIKILKKNKSKSLICQTNTDLYDLRKIVCSMGYYIKDEVIIFDNNRYYITIRFEIGKIYYSDEDYYLGPILRKRKTDIFLDYVKNMYKKNYLGYIESLKYNKSDIKLYKMMEILKKYVL